MRVYFIKDNIKIKKKLLYFLCIMFLMILFTTGKNKKLFAAELNTENINNSIDNESENNDTTSVKENKIEETQTEKNITDENKTEENQAEKNITEENKTKENEDNKEDEEEETADETAPVIKGVKKLTAYIGDKIDYKKGIKVTDDKDEKPILKVDSSKVNKKKPGIYKISYIATDESGNKTVAKTTIELKEKLIASPKTEKKMDAVLKKILKKGMSQKEKATAIFYWVKKNIRYSDYSTEKKYAECVDRAFVKYNGDCYVFAAVSQGLLTKAGIENIYISRIPTTFHHNWNIVKIDGKWSHFDTCPRRGVKEPILFMSDKKLMKLSNNLIYHRYAYKYDKKAYPKIK